MQGQEYDVESIKEILRLRFDEEKVKVEEDALQKITEIGAKSSLQYPV
jgi:DNA helicase TIP49 (TBP-interacting protein)